MLTRVGTALRALAWLAVTRVLLATLGFKAVQRALRMQVITPAEHAPGVLPMLDPAAWRTLAVSYHVVDLPALRTTCLPRAITIERMLAARGVASDVVIGVDKADGFRAHAWVEVDGYAVGADEAGSAAWMPLARFRSVKRAAGRG